MVHMFFCHLAAYFVTPFMVVTIMAKVVGKWCFGSQGIYDEIMKLKSLPFLEEDPPPTLISSVLKAKDIMSPAPLVLMQPEMRVSELIATLKSTHHTDFPVVDPSRDGVLIGSIQREHLIVMLCHTDTFMEGPSSEGQRSNSPPLSFDDLVKDDLCLPTLEDAEANITETDMEMYISISRHIQLSPYAFDEEGSAERAYELFRTLGLRNLIVTGSNARPVGVISRTDLKYLEMKDKIERGCRSQSVGSFDDSEYARYEAERAEKRPSLSFSIL